MAVADPSHFDDLIDFLQAEARERHLRRHHRAGRGRRAVAAGLLPGDGREGLSRAARDRRLYRSRCAREIGAAAGQRHRRTRRIPSAGQELGAIVKATEPATNTIMECAEALMAADASDPAAYKALVDEKMMIDLRGLLVPGHHRPAHRQGGRDAAAHRERASRALPTSCTPRTSTASSTERGAPARRAQGEAPAARPAARRRGSRTQNEVDELFP